MKVVVSARGNVGVASGVGGVLAAIVLAPFVLGAAIAAAAIGALSAGVGAGAAHRVDVSAATCSRLGWTVAALIPLGFIVAFFGHNSQALVEAGVYTSLGAVPASIALIVASVFAEG